VPVLPFGLDQRSGLMMGDGGIEQSRGRIRRVGGDAECRRCAGWSKTSPLLAAHGFIDGSLAILLANGPRWVKSGRTAARGGFTAYFLRFVLAKEFPETPERRRMAERMGFEPMIRL
jgi:hypothetical protein